MIFSLPHFMSEKDTKTVDAKKTGRDDSFEEVDGEGDWDFGPVLEQSLEARIE